MSFCLAILKNPANSADRISNRMELIEVHSENFPEDPVTNDPKLPAKSGFTSCHECKSQIDTTDQAAFVDRISHFVRLRCIEPDCLHVDWYKESEIETPHDATNADDESQVWVHDLLLGVS